ncbi:hypothetical protein P3875_00620 [Myroides sp. JBRI-B21084]|uniref:DUF7674 family protein n=1 Tax=Myroides sp. JBRI-B21084 TaxID=3119977 RepID=UPI0026E1D65C|nr:hypothetical protein [Paenimyroides cloacae]WKW46617.1 hypothetical protein P3875_00620 [Paenimyroides cloacae]
MKTKILNSIQQWVPESQKWLQEIQKYDNNIADCIILNKTANLCVTKINSGITEEIENAREIIKIINLLYQGGNQYTRNIIENEFLTVLSEEEALIILKKYIHLFPSELKKGYIKTILEN